MARENYYCHILSNFKNDIKNTWKTIRPLIGKTNEKTTIIEEFKINGQYTTDPQTVSNEFCDFFSQIGCKLQANIPPSRANYSDFLQSPEEKSIFMAPTTQQEVTEIFRSIKGKKSTDHDGLSSYLMKMLSESLAYPTSTLINRSIKEGHVPNCMKTAKVLPLYKNKERNQMTNYRPISILPALSKILKKVVHKRVYNFLNSNDRLYRYQFGFRKKTQRLMQSHNLLKTLS